MSKTLVCSLLFCLLFISCSKDSLQQNSSVISETIWMTAPNFIDGTLSKSYLTPSNTGTSFEWKQNDIVGVYSSSKGLTNFFIDENSISSDGLSANFNGAGFSLMPNAPYYALYPYSADALDKTSIPLNYYGQIMDSNGDTKNLGKYDYMYSTGLSDENNHLSFDFKHVGCVAEIKIKVPATSYYSSLTLEIENPSSTNYLIKSGTIDITEQNVAIKADPYQSNSTFSIKLGSNGIQVQKDAILTVYLMIPPQNLDGKNIVFKLIDTKLNWYKSIVCGQNMRAGYTYHYKINTLNEGFSGQGQGLPNDEHYAELMYSYTHPNQQPYYWLTADNEFLYATGPFGLRKYDYGTNTSLSLVSESSVVLGAAQTGRAMVVNDDLIYLGVRQNTGGLKERYSPDVSFFFETNLKNIYAYSQISNNDLVNKFIKKLRLLSWSKDDVDEIWIYKALQQDGVYKNVIQLRKKGVYVCNLYREVYSSLNEALSNLPSKYTNSAGDYIEMDWNVITNSCNCIKNVVFNTFGEFDSYEVAGSATFDETGTGNPNRGGYCAKFKTTSSGNNKAVVRYNKTGIGGSVSLMINSRYVPNNEVIVPLMSKEDTYVVSIILKPQGNGIQIGLKLGDTIYLSSHIFSTTEWYNLKINLTSEVTSLLIREKEGSSWTSLITVENSSTDISFDALCLGIVSVANNVELLIDDYYYNSKELDNVSFVNGALVIIDKKDLSIVNRYCLDFKVCGVTQCRNKLVVNFLNGFNVYNIDNPKNPKLIHTHRPKNITEFQGVGTFEANGRLYALTCIYTKGFAIIDLTDDNDIRIVKEFDFSSIFVDGETIQNHCYSFDVVVDYPYAYATVASTNSYCNIEKDHRGCITIDLHDINNPQLSFAEIPKSRLSRFTNCDQSPNRITKSGDCVFINNREYGIEVFLVGTDGRLTYGTHIAMPDASSSNAICATADGRLFVGDDEVNGTMRNIYFYRWW